MKRNRDDFEQVEWDEALEARCRQLAELAREEDLAGGIDHTAAATVPEDARGSAEVVARQPGVAAGLRAVPVLGEVFGADICVEAVATDAQPFAAGDVLARIEGRARDILAIERTMLNLLGRLCGIATLAHSFVETVAGTGVRLYDTRKTTPGWRRLEKYAVRCGGGCNHRAGLHTAILVKDNHIAAWENRHAETRPHTLAEMARSARDYALARSENEQREALLVEVEVDSLAQLEDVLSGRPDIVLLDNMSVATLREAVYLRDRLAPEVELEASGGVTLGTIRQIATTGVERISVGAMTHQAMWLDIGLDWTA